jgi:formate hydrogenlyase subunit 3/multisubunit Na+/H+ antiporter MnhD subunit
LLNFTVVAGSLFLLTIFLHYRTGTTKLIGLGGAAKTMPLLASFFLLFGLASMGLPGTNGFPAELLLIPSALKTHTGAGLVAIFSVVLGSGHFPGIYRKAFFGTALSRERPWLHRHNRQDIARPSSTPLKFRQAPADWHVPETARSVSLSEYTFLFLMDRAAQGNGRGGKTLWKNSSMVS